MEDREREEELRGQKGGSAEAFMPAGAVPRAVEVVAPIGRVLWGSLVSGLIVSLAVTILLTALGRGLGLTLRITGGGGLAYWTIIVSAVALFLGSMMAARQARVHDTVTGRGYGLLIWSLFLIADVVFGIAGFFSTITGTGLLRMLHATTAGTLTLAGAWWLVIGYVILLVAAGLGGAAGVVPEEEHGRH